MPDLDTDRVTAWFSKAASGHGEDCWPPPIRPIEQTEADRLAGLGQPRRGRRRCAPPCVVHRTAPRRFPIRAGAARRSPPAARPPLAAPGARGPRAGISPDRRRPPRRRGDPVRDRQPGPTGHARPPVRPLAHRGARSRRYHCDTGERVMHAVRVAAVAAIAAAVLSGGARAQTSTDPSTVNLGTLSSSPISQPGGGSPSSLPTSSVSTNGVGSTVSLAPALSSRAISQSGTGSVPTTPGTPTAGQPTTLTSGSAIGFGTTSSSPAVTQPSTGSAGCAAITQAAANGLTARINADNASINPPRSVTAMTCLSNFFNGIGLNVITNLLNPALLLQAVEYQICNAVQAAWNSTIGQIQCGLTLTGFNLGFGGLGGGLICPRLSFGGGGAPIASLGFGFGSYPGLYINGSGLPPTGYSLTNVPHGTY